MSFAADLKDFASNFRDTYKTLHVSGKDELASEQAAYLREELDAKARGEAEFNRGKGIGALNIPDARSSRADLSDPDFLPKVIAAEGGDPMHVAQVIRNRAAAAKANPLDVVAFEGAFEPVSSGSWKNQPPERVAAAKDAWRKVMEGKIDTLKGATHFYDADTQAKLGRSAPAWDTGTPVATGRGGARRFFRRPTDRFAMLDEETVPVVYAARGGVIPSGLDRALDTTEMENAGSNPVTRDVMDAERSSIDEDWDPRRLVDVGGARRAVAGGLKFGQRTLGLETHHAAVPEAARLNPDGVTALQTNAGAPTREEVAAVHQTVDPKGQLPEELREIAGFNALQKFWTARGEPQKAERAAWQMLQAGKKAVSQYGALALSIDDPVKRAEVIAKAHNQFLPDGEKLKITGKSGDGAKFELFDNKGQLSEKGVLAMDDMVKMATGMHNGTQYLQAMTNFATAAPTAVEKKDAKNQAAIAKFDADDDTMVVGSMSPTQREALNEMTPDVRSRAVEARRKALKMEYAEEQDALKRDDKIENRDYQRDWTQFKTALAQNNFDVKRNDVLTNAEKKFFLYEKDLDDRNKRFGQSQEARKQRDTDRAESLLRSRVGRAATQGIKLPAREATEARRVAGVEGVAADRMSAIDTAASDETGVNLNAEQRARRGAIAVGATFDRNMKEDDKSRKGRAEAMSETYDELAKLHPNLFDTAADGSIAPKKGTAPEALNALTGASVAAADVVRSSGLPAPVAARAIKEVIDRKRPIQIEQRGGETLVHMGNDMPPVRMSEDGFLQLMRMVGGQNMSKDQIQALQGPSWSNVPALPVDVRASSGGRQSLLGRIFEPVRDTPPNRVPSALPPRALDLEPALPEPGRKNTLINRMIDQYRR